MNLDYIIVGLGLAGIAFAEELTKNNKTFVVFEDNSQNSSLVAGGMYNPVVLKRFTPVWNAQEQLDIALPFYKMLEKKMQKKYDFPMDIYRVFKSIEEQNNWYEASGKKLLQDYMEVPVLANQNQSVSAPLGYGKLKNTGRIDVNTLAKDYRNYLQNKNKLIEECFDYADLKIAKEEIVYKNIKAKNIVFCEGFGLQQNPYFNYLPMKEAKGELITIHAPNLKVDFLIKSAVFVMPLGGGNYKVGATFNWKDKTKNPTEEGKKELVEKLNTVINCDYKIINHVAGIRPTVKDRRPLVGKHPKYKNLAILNGLGTRGVMIAPTMANKLFQYIENAKALEQEIDSKRFAKYFTQN